MLKLLGRILDAWQAIAAWHSVCVRINTVEWRIGFCEIFKSSRVICTRSQAKQRERMKEREKNV